MNKTISKAILIVVGIFLMFVLFVTYIHITEEVFLLSYIEKMLLLIAGPIPLLIYGREILFKYFLSGGINYFAIGMLVIMTLSVIVGLLAFNRSKLYKFIFGLGALLWFMFGLFYIGIHYITT